MKSILRKIANKTVLRPGYVRHCSQTIYQSLLGCIRMYEATRDEKWKNRSDHLLKILIKIQRPDGGFDIGYDFNFGMLHKKGQSTSPELVGLVALAEYARVFDCKVIHDHADRAAEWIQKRAIKLEDDKYAIPYGPYSTNEIMVYNGVSFAVGALGCFLRDKNNPQLENIYKGMVRYLNDVMSVDENEKGRFWFYNDISRGDLSDSLRCKIDYYHQMQQVEMHCLAQKAIKVDEQLNIIADASDHIVGLQEKNDVIPYYNKKFSDFSDYNIHLWGLSSVVAGMLEASDLIEDRRDNYIQTAKCTLNWILKYAWNGEYFFPILDSMGNVILSEYMVRSDAWVFDALACACKFLGSGPWLEIAEKCFCNMKKVDFSGPENHATTFSKRATLSLYRLMLNR